jgi:predicted metal-dependent hydrolase
MESMLRYKNTSIPYTAVRKRRKTIGISISEEKGVIVSVPQWATRKQIDEVLAQKKEWIFSKYQLISQRRAFQDNRSFRSGSPVLYLGHEYLLQIENMESQNNIRITIENNTIRMELPSCMETESPTEQEEQVRGVLEGWYRRQAANYLQERLLLYAEKMGVKPLKLSIRGQKKRWGSCSVNNSIQLNWKLMLAPGPVLDYVVVHELAHIREKNHSKDFWKLVETTLPDYRQRRAWLKENGYRLML